MIEAIEDQPHCESAPVHTFDNALDAKLAGSTADYMKFMGRFMEVEIGIDYEGVRVRTEMEMGDGHLLMKIVSVE